MRELTAEMIADALTVGDVAVSPDGSRIAYVLSPIGKKDEHPVSAIWLVNTNGEPSPMKLTAGTAADCTPRWSPDGPTVFFLSDRQKRGTFQLHRIPIAGGEAEAFTEWDPGITDFTPLPDGKSIAFIAVDPHTEEEKKRQEDRDDAQVYGERWPWQKLRILDLETREVSTIDALGERHIVQAVPSPDGARIAILAWPTPELDNNSWNSEILVVDLADSAVIPICQLPTGSSHLRWEPDGSRLLLIAHRGPASRGGHVILRVDANGGEPCQVSPALDACPMEIATSRDGTPYLLLAQGLDTWIGRLDAASHQIERIEDLAGDASSLSLSDDGQAMAVARRLREDAGNIWAGPVGGPMQQRTCLNPELRDIALGTQEPFSWRALDGLQIEGLLLLPPGATRADGPYPLLTLVHGGPYMRYADSLQLNAEEWGQWLAAAGYAGLLPNPRGSSGRGDDFADRVANAAGAEDWADIEAGIDHLIAEGIADPNRLGIGGWSYGGFMTAWAVGHTRRFKLGIMGAGISDFGMMIATSDLPNYARMVVGSAGWECAGPHPHDRFSPISFASQVETPLLILHGEEDPRVPVSQGKYYAQALRERNIPHQLVTYPREPHGIQERAHQLDLLHRVRDWVEHWLGPGWKMGESANA